MKMGQRMIVAPGTGLSEGQQGVTSPARPSKAIDGPMKSASPATKFHGDSQNDLFGGFQLVAEDPADEAEGGDAEESGSKQQRKGKGIQKLKPKLKKEAKSKPGNKGNKDTRGREPRDLI